MGKVEVLLAIIVIGWSFISFGRNRLTVEAYTYSVSFETEALRVDPYE
ncbi:hypothetical protein C900_03396 [Fulvivirga imtechensis AK7]|uniref:Uncharacterized protein n=1 Tax=Fulvivirga imtechensis AK7 TaxID=1237149 RepID=L8JRJ1_9BACT|nr:hypothetical protein C900_03396 [Fulvivirga imtechensis AK7]